MRAAAQRMAAEKIHVEQDCERVTIRRNRREFAHRVVLGKVTRRYDFWSDEVRCTDNVGRVFARDDETVKIDDRYVSACRIDQHVVIGQVRVREPGGVRVSERVRELVKKQLLFGRRRDGHQPGGHRARPSGPRSWLHDAGGRGRLDLLYRAADVRAPER